MDLASYYYYGSFSILRTAKSIPLVRARYKDERRKQKLFIMSFSQRFLPQKLWTRKQEQGFDFIQTVLSSKIFPKHD